MKFSFDATLLKAFSKPYDFQNNKGISFRANVLVDGTLFACKIEPDYLDEIKDFVEVKGVAEFELQSIKENISLYLVKFTPAV